MSKANLTAGRIEALRPVGKNPGFLWDTQVNGLGVRASPGGSKAFVLQSRFNGKVVRITIGDVTAWAIEEARDKNGNLVTPGARQEARRLQALIDQGIDPRQEKRERISNAEAKRAAEQRSEAPALEAWNAYIEARRPRWGKWSLRDHERVSQEGGADITRGRRPGQSSETQPGVLRPLLLLPLREIDADCVRAWLRGEAPYRATHARLAYRLLRGFLNWCADRKEYKGLVHADACAARIARDELPKAGAKDDCLQREQLRPWFEEVRAIRNPVISAYLQVTLLTGRRREQIAELQWSDIDFHWQTIRMRDKVEGDATVPLPPYVAALLLNLKRINDTPPPKNRILHGKIVENDLENWRPSKWVFSSPGARAGYLQDPGGQLAKVCRDAGLPKLTIHGLRRSFGTLSEWVECPSGVVAQLQGHAPSATAEKHYRRRPLDLLRVWHTKIEGWILEQAGIEQPTLEMAAVRRVVLLDQSKDIDSGAQDEVESNSVATSLGLQGTAR